MRPFSWFTQKPIPSPKISAPSFRPALESLGDRIAPHAGLWTSFDGAFNQFGVIAPTDTTTQVATHVAVIAQPAAYAGGEARFVVIALDANNRPVKNYTGTIHFTSTDTAATLPADYTFTADDHGRHTFTATLNTEGSQTITATDTTTSTITGDGKITVNAAQVATRFYVSIERAAYAGAETRVAVIALDANNRPDTSYTGTVAITTSDSGATLPANYTFTASDHGVHIFTITPSVAGSLTVTATDTTTSTVVGTATTTVAAPQVVTKLAIVSRPVALSGSTVTVFVVALDANNRPVTNYTGTVAITSSDSAATLPASYTFTAADRGVKSFTVTLATAGSQTITATDTATSTLLGTTTVTVLDSTSLPTLGGGFFGGGPKSGRWGR